MRMKYLFALYAAVFHPKRFFREGTTMLLSRIYGESGNSVTSQSSWIKKTRIRIAGEDNTVSLNHCDIYNANILLRGNGHRLIIEDGVTLYNVRIKIIGRNNIVHIGAGSSMGGGNIICGGTGIPVQIGNRSVIAEGTDIWASDTHSIFHDNTLVNQPEPIHIGDNVWIGKDVAILKGVSIGDGAIVGMRSVITHDVPEKTLVAGSPAKMIRQGVSWSLANPNNEV